MPGEVIPISDRQLERRARGVMADGTAAEVDLLLTECAVHGLSIRAEVLRLERRRAELLRSGADAGEPGEAYSVAVGLERLGERWERLVATIASLRRRREALLAM